MRVDPIVAGRVASDTQLWHEFNALCDCGGRLAGTASERAAIALVRASLASMPGIVCRSIPVPYNGWRAVHAGIEIGGRSHRCHPLVRSMATPADGLTAEVIDLGRGTPEEFEAHASEIAGRIVLVRHELMFAAGTIHRRRKYELARAAGAAGFLIAAPAPGLLVTGSSGRTGDEGIPALGITPETAALLRRSGSGHARATMRIETVEAPAVTETLVAEVPGTTDGWVVLSAHVDGHDINESAMDNASGVACALAVLRALASEIPKSRRGLRVMFFSAEEWALIGSAQYVQSLSDAERSAIALNVNLDSVAGASRLTAMTSNFAGLEPFLLSVAESSGLALRTVRPLMMNSDHANFAVAGIPAFRLVAGYDDPAAHLRLVLTNADTRDKVAPGELKQAALLAAAITHAACEADAATASTWRNL